MTGIRLHVLDLGQLRLKSSVLVGDGPSPFPEIVSVPVSAYCIDHPDGRVLFDTGCHPQAMGPDGRWPAEFQRDYAHSGGEECTLPNRLAEIGLGPDDLRYVVLSHMHSDHAGCVEFFRKSQLIVHAEELAAVIDAHKRADDSTYTWKDTDAWIRAPLDWRRVETYEGDLRLHDDVTILNLGRGHASGMLALTVRLRGAGEIVLASDTVYCAENIGQPARLPGYSEDEAGYRRALDRIRGLTARGAQLWYGHDPRQFATLRKSTDGAYE